MSGMVRLPFVTRRNSGPDLIPATAVHSLTRRIVEGPTYRLAPLNY